MAVVMFEWPHCMQLKAQPNYIILFPHSEIQICICLCVQMFELLSAAKIVVQCNDSHFPVRKSK